MRTGTAARTTSTPRSTARFGKRSAATPPMSTATTSPRLVAAATADKSDGLPPIPMTCHQRDEPQPVGQQRRRAGRDEQPVLPVPERAQRPWRGAHGTARRPTATPDIAAPFRATLGSGAPTEAAGFSAARPRATPGAAGRARHVHWCFARARRARPARASRTSRFRVVACPCTDTHLVTERGVRVRAGAPGGPGRRGARYPPPQARVRRGGAVRSVPAAELVPGDVVVLGEGDRVPADGRLLTGAVEIDASALTGESAPVDRVAGAPRHGRAGARLARAGVQRDWLRRRVRLLNVKNFDNDLCFSIPNANIAPKLSTSIFKIPNLGSP